VGAAHGYDRNETNSREGGDSTWSHASSTYPCTSFIVSPKT